MTLQKSLRLRIERHFLRCDGCSALYDGLRQVIYLVNESDLIELPVGLSQRLFQRLNMKPADPVLPMEAMVDRILRRENGSGRSWTWIPDPAGLGSRWS